MEWNRDEDNSRVSPSAHIVMSCLACAHLLFEINIIGFLQSVRCCLKILIGTNLQSTEEVQILSNHICVVVTFLFFYLAFFSFFFNLSSVGRLLVPDNAE